MRLTTDYPEYIQCYAFVEVPFLDGDGNDEATKEQQDNPVHVLIGYIGKNNIEVAG